MAGSESKLMLQPKRPYWLLLELTYRCPLQCPYCSNPVASWNRRGGELTTEDWKRVLREARALGSVQLGLSGGEPLLRDDLEEIIRHARELGLYTNLITSGLGLNERRLQRLVEAGIDHIQLSFQAPQAELNNKIAGRDSFDRKIKAARLIKRYPIPMVLNFVIHRQNAHQIEEMILLSRDLKADYVELANTQYYGLARLNQNHLFPFKEQIQEMQKVVSYYQEKFREVMKIFYILPDYYEQRPKPCSNGWGNTLLAIDPQGLAYPCLGASSLSPIAFPNVKEKSLAWIWEESEAFNLFRGDQWMPSPCRTCPEREVDFGGCRCQAYLLLGDAAQTDPVCSLSPHHSLVEEFVLSQNQTREDGEFGEPGEPRGPGIWEQIRFRNDPDFGRG